MDGNNINFDQISDIISNLLPQILPILDLKNIILNGAFKYKAHDGKNLQIDNFRQLFDNLSSGIDYSRIQNLKKANKEAEKELVELRNKKKLTEEENLKKQTLKTLVHNNKKIIDRYKNTEQPSKHIQSFMSGFLDYESRNFKFLITIIRKIITIENLDSAIANTLVREIEVKKIKKPNAEKEENKLKAQQDKVRQDTQKSLKDLRVKLSNALAEHAIKDEQLTNNEKETIKTIIGLIQEKTNTQNKNSKGNKNNDSNSNEIALSLLKNAPLLNIISQAVSMLLFTNVHFVKDFALNFAKNIGLQLDDLLSIQSNIQKNKEIENRSLRGDTDNGDEQDKKALPSFVKNIKLSTDSKIFSLIKAALKIISFKKDIFGNQEGRDNFLKNIEKLQMLLYFQLHLISTINSKNTDEDKERFKKDIAQLISSFQDQYNKIAVSFISKIYFLRKSNAFAKIGLWIGKKALKQDPIELILENAISLPNGHIIAVDYELTIEIAKLRKKLSKKTDLQAIKKELIDALNRIKDKYVVPIVKDCDKSIESYKASKDKDQTDAIQALNTYQQNTSTSIANNQDKRRLIAYLKLFQNHETPKTVYEDRESPITTILQDLESENTNIDLKESLKSRYNNLIDSINEEHDKSIKQYIEKKKDEKQRQCAPFNRHIGNLIATIENFSIGTGETKSTIDALALHLNLNPQDYNKNNTVCSVANDNLGKLNKQILEMNGLANEELLIENNGGIIFPNHQKQNTAETVIFQPTAPSNQSHSSQNIQQQQKNNTIFYGATGAAVGISAVGIPVTLTGNINTEKKILISLAIILLAVVAIVVSKVVSDKINYKDSQEVSGPNLTAPPAH